MGIISCLKIGYKWHYLCILLDTFDQEGGYDLAAERRNHQRRGCKGVHFGGKPHVLDCMEMLKKVWEGKDGKYVSDESVSRCWRKADMLPPTWNADINNNVGSASLPGKVKTLDKEDTFDLCQLMADVKLKANGVLLDTNHDATVFKDTFVSDPDCGPQDL
eukprot:1430537-Ditylum_brightwellii.AAC.1